MDDQLKKDNINILPTLPPFLNDTGNDAPGFGTLTFDNNSLIHTTSDDKVYTYKTTFK